MFHIFCIFFFFKYPFDLDSERWVVTIIETFPPMSSTHFKGFIREEEQLVIPHLNQMWKHRNQKRVCLLNGRLFTGLFFWTYPNMERRTTSTLRFKTIDYNVIEISWTWWRTRKGRPVVYPLQGRSQLITMVRTMNFRTTLRYKMRKKHWHHHMRKKHKPHHRHLWGTYGAPWTILQLVWITWFLEWKRYVGTKRRWKGTKLS